MLNLLAQLRRLSVSQARLAIEVKMPALSPTMTDGMIVKWHKTEGMAIDAGDVLCDIQTDKAIVAFDTDDEGTMAKILIAENASTAIPIGTLIAVIAEEGEDWKAIKIPTESTSIQDSPPEKIRDSSHSAPKATTITTSPKPELQKGSPRLRSPAARLLLEKYGLASASVPFTGPKNTLLKSDVLTYVSQHNLQAVKLQPSTTSEISVKASPTAETKARHQPSHLGLTTQQTAASPYSDISVLNERRSAAHQMASAKVSVPHAYATAKCNIDRVLKLGDQLPGGSTLSDFVIYAVANALTCLPEANSTFFDGSIHQLTSVNVGLVLYDDISTPKTVTLHDVGNAGLGDISAMTKTLIDQVSKDAVPETNPNNASIVVHDLSDSGINQFSDIVQSPQTAILTIGSIQEEFQVKESLEIVNISPYRFVTLTLSADARVLDEVLASNLLRRVCSCLEAPEKLL